MGIKFRCPNGHKLNVKAFLAGKKGVCPKCGTRMRIPSVSTEGGDSDIGETAAAALGVAEPATGANGSAHPSPVSPSPIAAPVTPTPGPAAIRHAPAAPAVPVGVPVAVGSPVMTAAPAMPAAPATARPAVAMPAMPAPMPVGAPVRPAMPAPQPGPLPAGPMPPAVAAADPIAEAPAASWYVRPPSGVQYGPARGDVMRKWIAEGRVSSDSLVWREGWADWQNAGQLFPNLAAVSAATGAAVAAVPSTTAIRSATRYQTKKKSGSGMAVAFLAVLAVVCVVLVGVLVYVLTTVK